MQTRHSFKVDVAQGRVRVRIVTVCVPEGDSPNEVVMLVPEWHQNSIEPAASGAIVSLPIAHSNVDSGVTGVQDPSGGEQQHSVIDPKLEKSPAGLVASAALPEECVADAAPPEGASGPNTDVAMAAEAALKRVVMHQAMMQWTYREYEIFE